MRLGRQKWARFSVMAAFAGLALIGMSAAAVAVRLLQPMGLQARYFLSETMDPAAQPVLTTIDERPDTATLRSHAAEVSVERFTAVWEGFVVASRSGAHRFELESDDGSRLYLDGIIALDNWGQHEARTVRRSLPLTEGAHRIRIEYQQLLGEAILQLRWDGAREGAVRPIESDELSSQRPLPVAWQVRGTLARSGPLLASIWTSVFVSLVFVPAILYFIRQLSSPPGPRRLLAAVIGVTLVINALGSWWGLPPWSWLAWAPDEVLPGDVLEAIQVNFGNGWSRPYPAGHYYVLSWLFAPLLVAARLGLVDPAVPPSTTFLALFLVARLATVLMAALTVMVVHLIGQELYGSRVGAFAAFVTAFAIPFGFYSKVANLEVPYIFWFALSFWFYARIVLRGGAADHYGYALAATLSICTKDQAYGLYMLPSLHILLMAWRSDAGGAKISAVWTRLAGPVLAAGAAFALLHNFAFNFGGFVHHVKILAGPQSGNFRMFESDPAGQFRLFVDIFPLFRWMFGWAGLVLIAVGIWRIAAQQPGRRHWWIFLPSLSYYLTFIAVVGYHYDRYWLPLLVAFALTSGLALDWFLRPGGARLPARLAGAAAMALLAWRGLSADAMMLMDSRYDAERWLQSNVGPRVPIYYVGGLSYLPRFDGLDVRQLDTAAAMAAQTPQPAIVVNIEYMQRYQGRDEEVWWQWMRSERSPYRVAYRIKHRPWWSAMSYEPRLYTGVEDRYTNFGKVNPDIAVFTPASAASEQAAPAPMPPSER